MMNILLPTDFSDNSLNACAYTFDLFGTAGTLFTVVHAYRELLPGYEAVNSLSSDAYVDGVEEMAAFVDRLRKLPAAKDAVFIPTVVKGSLPDVLAELSTAKNADLIAMGTQGAAGAALFGSHASAVATKSTAPVLVVPRDARYHGLHRILFADDHAPLGPSGMNLVVDLARRTDAHLAVAHVQRDHSDATDKAVRAEREALLAGVDHSYIEASGDDVAHALSSLAERVQADLVAARHHHSGFLEGLFHTSTTRQLVLHSHTPLLVLGH